MNDRSPTTPLAYQRWARKDWGRVARRLALATLAAAVAMAVGAAAVWLVVRAGTRARATPSGAVAVAWQLPPLSGRVVDGVRVVRTSSEGVTASFDLPTDPATDRLPAAWTDRFAEPGMRYTYALSLYRNGIGPAVPLGERSVTTRLPVIEGVDLRLLDPWNTEGAGRGLVLGWDQTVFFAVRAVEAAPAIVRRVRVQADDGSGWRDLHVGPYDGPYVVLDGEGLRPTNAFRVRRENRFTGDGSVVASPWSSPVRIPPPAPPRDLSVRHEDPHEDNHLYLEWEHDFGDATHLAVQHRPAGGDWRDAATATSWREAATTYAGPFEKRVAYVDVLPDGLAYDFRVRAEIRLDDPRREACGESFDRPLGPADDRPAVPSEWVVLRGVLNPILAPSHVNAVAVPPGRPGGSPTIRVEWRDNRSHQDGTGSLIERRPADGDGWREVGRAPGGAEAFHDRSVDPSATYFYRVTATQDADAPAGARTADHNDVTAADHVHLRPPATRPRPHDVFRDGPLVMRATEMNAPHAYVEIEFAADVALNPATADADDWALIRATANGDLLYEKLVWIDPADGTQAGEQRYGYPWSSDPCDCRGQPPHHRVSYPTQADDVTVRIEGETNASPRAMGG